MSDTASYFSPYSNMHACPCQLGLCASCVAHVVVLVVIVYPAKYAVVWA